jgi:hypothetical protein
MPEAAFTPDHKEFSRRFLETHEVVFEPADTTSMFPGGLLLCRNSNTGETFVFAAPRGFNPNYLVESVTNLFDEIAKSVQHFIEYAGGPTPDPDHVLLEAASRTGRPNMDYLTHAVSLRTLREHVSQADIALMIGQ